MIAKVKAVADGKGDAGFQATLDKKLQKQKKALLQITSKSYMDPSIVLTNWIFGGLIIKHSNPDLYSGTKNSRVVMGRDDSFGSFARMQATFCAQTLAFERRGMFYDICAGTKVKSFYPNKPELDLGYKDYLPSQDFAAKVRASSNLTGKGICAMTDFNTRNIVQWLKDQDAELYNDDSME